MVRYMDYYQHNLYLFGGKIEFKVACIGVAVVSFAAALIMIALDKKLSALVD